MRLTEISLKNLSFLEKGQRRIRDDSLPGFGVTVGTRRKSFFVMYGEGRNLKTLGHWPEMTLRDARTAAKQVLANTNHRNGSQSITELLTAYLDDCKERLRPSTAERYEYALAPHREKIDLTTSDPNEIKALKAFYNWCLDRDLLDRNPLARRRVTFNTRDRLLTDDEIVAIWNYDHPPYSDLIKLLILTGQRRNQISSFDPDWVKGDELHFPASIMKTRRAHIIPITDYDQYLQTFSMSGWSKMKVRMDRHTKVTDYVLHDFRRYFSSTCARLGIPLHITEQILDHRSTVSGIAATYNLYQFIPEMREALVTYHTHVAKLVNAQG